MEDNIILKVKMNARIDSKVDNAIENKLLALKKQALKHRIKIKKEDLIEHLITLGLLTFDPTKYIETLKES